MSQYIPDITERFPEGFDGVDLTDSYFPSRRTWDSYGASDYWESVDEINRQEREAMERGEL